MTRTKVEKKKPVGLLGGTFNPIHNGHVAIAEAARALFELDVVWLMPAYGPPHKGTQALTSSRDRLRMVELAVAGLDWASVCTAELVRGGTSFAVDTVKELRACCPALRFYFIIGMDSLLELHGWYRSEELVGLCEFCTLLRPGAPDAPKATQLGFPPAIASHLLGNVRTGPQVDVSSTQVRDRIARGEDWECLVPRAVAVYIKAKGLYQANASS